MRIHLSQETIPLTVQPEVLGEALRAQQLESPLHKVAHGKGILVWITAGESLISRIEEWEQLLLLANIGNLLPLVLRGIHTGGIVRTSVQNDDRTFGGPLQIFDHALEVDSAPVLVPVAIGARFGKSGVHEHLVVIFPRGRRVVERGSLQDATQELGTDPQGSRSRQALDTEGTFALDGFGVVTE